MSYYAPQATGYDFQGQSMQQYQPYASQAYQPQPQTQQQYMYESAPAPVSQSLRYGEADNGQFQQQQGATNFAQSFTSVQAAPVLQAQPQQQFVQQAQPQQQFVQQAQQLQQDDMTGCRVSPPRVQADQVREPTPAPIVRQEVERAPTPEGDVIERTVYKREPQEIIEKVIQQPRKPAPRTVVKVVQEPRQAPITRTKCVLVEPRNRGGQSTNETVQNVQSAATVQQSVGGGNFASVAGVAGVASALQGSTQQFVQ